MLVISDKIQELRGKGSEILLDKDGNFLAEFYDGNLVSQVIVLNSDDITKTCA